MFKNVMFGYAVFTFNQLYALPMIAFVGKKVETKDSLNKKKASH